MSKTHVQSPCPIYSLFKLAGGKDDSKGLCGRGVPETKRAGMTFEAPEPLKISSLLLCSIVPGPWCCPQSG